MTGKQVAIKHIELETSNKQTAVIYLKSLVSEVQILRKLSEQRDNIYTTKLLDLIVPEVAPSEQIKWVVIVMDYVQSDLRTALIKGK